MKEEVLQFGKRSSMVGILNSPEGFPNLELPAVLFLNAGLIHHIGPNRIYVKMARQFAQMGFFVLRFDSSGIGDSAVRQDNLPYEKSIVDDVQQAMNHLSQVVGVKTFVLMGHCSGSLSSFRVAVEDQRVIGAVLMNPEGGNPEWVDYDRKRKQAHYYQNYYGRKVLFSRDRWVKFLSGQASYRNVFRNLFRDVLWYKISTKFFQYKNRSTVKNAASEVDPAVQQYIALFHSVVERKTDLLLIYPQDSTGLVLTRTMLANDIDKLKATGKFNLVVLPECDHLYTLKVMQERLFKVIEDWMNAITELTPESGVL